MQRRGAHDAMVKSSTISANDAGFEGGAGTMAALCDACALTTWRGWQHRASARHARCGDDIDLVCQRLDQLFGMSVDANTQLLSAQEVKYCLGVSACTASGSGHSASQVMVPIVKLLRLCDGEKPAIGKIADRMFMIDPPGDRGEGARAVLPAGPAGQVADGEL